jgi:hypothetical protein
MIRALCLVSPARVVIREGLTLRSIRLTRGRTLAGAWIGRTVARLERVRERLEADARGELDF